MNLENRKLDIEEAKVQIDAEKANAEIESDVIESDSKQNIEYIKLQKELADLEKKKIELMNRMSGV